VHVGQSDGAVSAPPVSRGLRRRPPRLSYRRFGVESGPCSLTHRLVPAELTAPIALPLHFTFAPLYPRAPTFPRGVGLTDTAALTVRDVADMLNVDPKTVYRLAQKHALPGFKVAGTWRFMRSDIIAWIDKQKPKESG